MFLRLLLSLLVALNLGVAGWLLLGNGQRPLPPATDPGVPELRLLSERAANQEESSAELNQAPQKAPGINDQCFALGPFTTEADVRRALDALTPHVSGIRFRRKQVSKSRGWWVYLPAFSSRDEALQAARKLSSMGVQDYYVVTAGDRENTISLGLFRVPDNARGRRAKIADLGFDPVMHERKEQVLQFFVDYALPQGQTLDWQQYVQAPNRVGQTQRACF